MEYFLQFFILSEPKICKEPCSLCNRGTEVEVLSVCTVACWQGAAQILSPWEKRVVLGGTLQQASPAKDYWHIPILPMPCPVP